MFSIVPIRPSLRSACIGAFAATLGIGCNAAEYQINPQQAGKTAGIRIDASRALGPVNRFVFGHNVEAADGEGIFSGTVKNSLLSGSGFWDPVKRAPNPALLARLKNDLRVGMLRYPGGCLVHNFDWRKAVGPLESRGDWQFGIPEFIALCRAAGAEPLFTVSDYVLPAEEMPRHAAELVEYLNAPATPQHPWAMKRAEWGHPEPFHVKWFELGNESDHGNHRVIPKRIFTAGEYADYAKAVAAAMRAVDPLIKIGVVMEPGDATHFDCEWNRTVLREAGPTADFVIVHLYVPKAGKTFKSLLAAMAVGDQVARHFQTLRAIVRQETGKDLPLAVTEFNASIDSQDKLRFSYGAALASADLVRFFLEPASGVVTANYWNLLNGWFGMLVCPSDGLAIEPVLEKAAYPLFRLWGRHFGDRLVAVDVSSPKAGFPGAGSVYASIGGTWVEPKLLGSREVVPFLDRDPLERMGIPAKVSPEGVLKIELTNTTGDVYPVIAALPRNLWQESGALMHRIAFEARFVPADSRQPPVALGIGLSDPRGWKATGSAMAVRGISTPEWKAFSGDYLGLSDASGVDVVARLEVGRVRVSGTLEVRNLRIETFTPPHAPEFDLVTASASTSNDGRTLYLMVFNKSDSEAVAANIDVSGFDAQTAMRWEINAPSLESQDGVRETIVGEPFPIEAGAARVVLPPHSMSAIEFSNE